MSIPWQDLQQMETKDQENLVQFLLNEVRLGNTFIESAELAKLDNHLDHYERLKQELARLSQTAKMFVARVSDSAIRAEIEQQLDALDQRRSTLS
jgi:hypothetical protein